MIQQIKNVKSSIIYKTRIKTLFKNIQLKINDVLTYDKLKYV
jgi:hypothetical protein